MGKEHLFNPEKHRQDRVQHTILIFNNNNKESINPVNLTFACKVHLWYQETNDTEEELVQ